MIRFEHQGADGSFGIEYRFDFPGDSLPPHGHTATDAHSVQCLKGRVGVSVVWRDSFGNSRGTSRVLTAGELYVIDWWHEHWITALDPESVTFHRFLNGQPDEYKRFTAEQRAGIFTYGGNRNAADDST